MKNFRLIVFCVVLFFLKESVSAQPESSFKNIENPVDSTSIKTGNTRLKENDSFLFLPSIGVSAGLHDLGFKSSKISFSPVSQVFINFPFDRKEYFNWETAFYVAQFKESEAESRTAFSMTYAGLKIYATKKNTVFRPYISAGLAGHTLYILPTLNVHTGIEYRVNHAFSVLFSISTLSTNKDGSIRYSEEKKNRMTAAFLGMRYQL